MHPIERLRYVARASGADPRLLAREVAGALAAISAEPAGLVTACRRLVERHPVSGPVWWMAARVLASGDPGGEAWSVADDLDSDRTVEHLVACLPDEATVAVVGWPDLVADALPHRGDLEVLVIDSGGEGSAFARHLASAGLAAFAVPDSGAGSAARQSMLVVLEALAAGPGGIIAAAGSLAAAAVAHQAGIPVWAAAGRGRVLPPRLWSSLCALHQAGEEAWCEPHELVPLDLIDVLVRPRGRVDAATAATTADGPEAPELLKLQA